MTLMRELWDESGVQVEKNQLGMNKTSGRSSYPAGTISGYSGGAQYDGEDKGVTVEALTEEQIKNWRNVLCSMLGPYALIMPVAEIHRIRDCSQDTINDLYKKVETET